jgi:hypothetical protein
MKTSRLPIGIQNLREIIEDKCAYVDKTPFIEALLSGGKYYFLSRPRRFGKSLFLDTLKEFFEGNEKLFKSLYIHDKWDWNKQYPVVKIDFAAGVLRNREELDIHIFEILKENQRRLGLEGEMSSISGGFKEVIRQAHEKYGKRVVILVDEYDKPILDNIERPHVTAEMRDGVKNLYSVMKNQDSHIRFAFMTGVSKFSKVSLFSGINQLEDITLDSNFATICGYTHRDLETIFVEHLAGVDMATLRRWYNGYSFLGEAVYNPYDILLFISKNHTYRNYWFETGSPSFLIKMFQKKRYFLPDLEDIEVNEEMLDSFDIDRINPITLLFQSGYLTISDAYQALGESVFRLKVPNHEVRVALSNQLIGGYTDIVEQRLKYKGSLFDTMKEGDLDGMIATIKRLFAAIPWRNFTKNKLPEAEGYYASVLYAFFASLNATIIPEDISNHGQVDMTIKLEGYIYVIEIKLVKDEDSLGSTEENVALKQIQQRGYSKKYQHQSPKGLIELGLVFSSVERNLIQADWLELECS